MELERKTAVRTLVNSRMTAKDLLKVVFDETSEMLKEEEDIKEHPLKTIILTEEQFTNLANHMLDGGGSIDRIGIGKLVLQDLVNKKQSDQFTGNMIHYIKTCLKLDGLIIPSPDGSNVTINGIAPNPPAESFRDIIARQQKEEETSKDV